MITFLGIQLRHKLLSFSPPWESGGQIEPQPAQRLAVEPLCPALGVCLGVRKDELDNGSQWAQPDNNTRCARVNLAHEGNLDILLGQIVLVSADSVDPERSGLAPVAEGAKAVLQICRDLKGMAVNGGGPLDGRIPQAYERALNDGLC